MSTTAVRLGLALPTRELLLEGRPDPAPLLELAEAAEARGFDSVWVGDGLTSRSRLDPLTLLAAIGARTTRITLGTAVLLAPLRHPVLLAHQATSLDWLTGGRLVLGLGSGFPGPEGARQSAHLQVDHATRHVRLRETLRFLKLYWATAPGEAVDFEGSTFTVKDLPIATGPARSGGPPIWLPGSGPRTLERVGHLADGWLPYPPDPRRYAAQWAQVTAAAAVVGRPQPTPALYATLSLDARPHLARERLDRSIQRYYGHPRAAVGSVQALFAGTPRAAAVWIASYVRGGAREVIVRFAGLDPRRGIDLMQTQVVPHLNQIMEES